MLYARRLVLSWVATVGILASACQSDDATPAMPEIVPAGVVSDDAHHPLVARYWAELSPEGRLDLHPIYPGNVIYRGRLETAVNYDYSGTAAQDSTTTCATPPCLPAANDQVTLYTDQAKVTYVDGSNTCFSNGVTFTGDPSCGGKLPPGDTCRRQHVFCAPIAVVSRVTFGQTVGAMPNPVLQITDPANGTSGNRVLGCNDQDPAGPASGEHGLCAFTNASKVDDPTTSNLISPIPGNGVSNFGCSFCYGNQFQATTRNLPGLTDTVLSDAPPAGVDPTLAAVNTDKLVIDLQNDNDLNMVMTLRYSAPALEPGGTGAQLFYDDTSVTPTCTTPPCPATCLTRGKTRMTLNGASFGPPGACLAGTQPISSCPAQGAPGAAYRLSVPGFATPQAPQVWADTRVEFTPPAATMTECGVKLTTPVGTTVTSDAVDICNDQWRTWTPTLSGATITRIGAAAGVLSVGAQQFIVLAGGRTQVNGFGSVINSTLTMPLPSCANPTPNWSTPTLTGSGQARWGMAYTVAANKLFVLGGAAGGGAGASSCARTAKMFRMTSTTAGTWTDLPAIPDMDVNGGNQGLCDAVMTTVRSPSRKEWVVVTGGSVRPVPNNACNGGDLPTLANGRYTLVLDPGAASPTWTLFSSLANVDNDGVLPFERFGAAAAAASSATSPVIVVGGSQSTGGPGTTVKKATTLTLSNTGVPTFVEATAASGLPSGQFLGAAAGADNAVYLSGGATAVAVSGTCNSTTRGNLPAMNRLLRLAGSLVGPWTTLTAMPSKRVEHVLLSAETTGGSEDKLYVIGGHDGSGTAATTIFEYTP